MRRVDLSKPVAVFKDGKNTFEYLGRPYDPELPCEGCGSKGAVVETKLCPKCEKAKAQ